VSVPEVLPTVDPPYRWERNDGHRRWEIVVALAGGWPPIPLAWVNDEFIDDAQPEARDAELARLAGIWGEERLVDGHE
jgi:hypothetical protein